MISLLYSWTAYTSDCYGESTYDDFSEDANYDDMIDYILSKLQDEVDEEDELQVTFIDEEKGYTIGEGFVTNSSYEYQIYE